MGANVLVGWGGGQYSKFGGCMGRAMGADCLSVVGCELMLGRWWRVRMGSTDLRGGGMGVNA